MREKIDIMIISFLLDYWREYPGSLTRVASGPYGVWGVSPAHAIFKKTMDGWERIQGSLKDISVGKNSAWGVNKHDDIFTRSGSGGWKHIPGKLMQVLNPLLNYHIPTLLFQGFCQWV